MASKDRTQVSDASIPFGAMEPPKDGKSSSGRTATKKKKKKTTRSKSEAKADDAGEAKSKKASGSESPKDSGSSESGRDSGGEASAGDGQRRKKKRNSKGKIDWRKSNKRRGKGRGKSDEDGDGPRSENMEVMTRQGGETMTSVDGPRARVPVGVPVFAGGVGLDCVAMLCIWRPQTHSARSRDCRHVIDVDASECFHLHPDSIPPPLPLPNCCMR